MHALNLGACYNFRLLVNTTDSCSLYEDRQASVFAGARFGPPSVVPILSPSRAVTVAAVGIAALPDHH